MGTVEELTTLILEDSKETLYTLTYQDAERIARLVWPTIEAANTKTQVYYDRLDQINTMCKGTYKVSNWEDIVYNLSRH